MPKLVFNFGTPEAQEFQLKPGENFVGRDSANYVQIEDDSVSGVHAVILVDGESAKLTDLGSTNGTRVNQFPATECSLQSGSKLEFGTVELVFLSDLPAVAAVAAPNSEKRVATGTTPTLGPPRSPEFAAAAPAISLSASTPTSSGTGIFIPLPPPPNPVAQPPLAPPIPPPRIPIKRPVKSVCRYHPKTPGRWSCPQCGQYFCDLCVGTRRAAEGTMGYFCRQCGMQCSPMAVQIETNPIAQASFYSVLPGAFKYPFQHDGVYILVGGTLFFTVLGFLKRYSILGFSFILQVIFLGYLFAYMQDVINTTAVGDEREPSFPDVTNFLEDIVEPCFQLIGVVLVCFGPAIGFLIWAYMAEDKSLALWSFPAMVLGCLYFPMAFLALSMLDTITAINPMIVVPAIFKVPLQYLVACAILGIVFTVRWLGNAFLPMLIPIPIVPTLISSFIGLYFLTVECRILGLFYLTNRQRLGWYKQH